MKVKRPPFVQQDLLEPCAHGPTERPFAFEVVVSWHHGLHQPITHPIQQCNKILNFKAVITKTLNANVSI